MPSLLRNVRLCTCKFPQHYIICILKFLTLQQRLRAFSNVFQSVILRSRELCKLCPLKVLRSCGHHQDWALLRRGKMKTSLIFHVWSWGELFCIVITQKLVQSTCSKEPTEERLIHAVNLSAPSGNCLSFSHICMLEKLHLKKITADNNYKPLQFFLCLFIFAVLDLPCCSGLFF